MTNRAREIEMKILGIAVATGAACVALVMLATHVVSPRLLTHYERLPALADMPKRTTARGVPADPINVALVGSAEEITTALRAAHWTAAEPRSPAADIRIAESVLLDRPDSAAPVSDLFLFGRRQDLAFEQQVGESARSRHHVRLWRAGGATYEGRPLWIGGATFDLRVGLSHRGLHPTHHIAPDIDQEREALAAALARVGQASETFRVTGVGVRVNAHNGEGDRYDTDGELRVLVIPPSNAPHAPPTDPGVPPLVALKDRLWGWAHAH